MFSKKFFLSCIGSLAFSVCAFSTQIDQLPKGLEADIEHILETLNVPGASVAVVQGDQVLLCKGYGKRNLEKDLPMTPYTLMPVASVTKTLTAMIISQLEHEGKLSSKDLLVDHLPQFTLKDPDHAKKITIEDMVAHRTGIFRHDLFWYLKHLNKDELFDRMAKLSPSNPLRETYQYNNIMYLLLGMIIEKVTNTTYEEALKERVLDPLHMKASTSSLDELRKSKDFALPYCEMQDKLVEYSFLVLNDSMKSAGGLNSNVFELSKILKYFLSEKEKLPVHTLTNMNQKLLMIDPSLEIDDLAKLNYCGFGLFNGKYHDLEFLWHGGLLPGFSSEISFLYKEGDENVEPLGIAILTNSSSDGHFAVSAIRNKVVNTIFGYEDNQTLNHCLEAKKKSSKKIADALKKYEQLSGPKNAAEYVGTFHNEFYGAIQMSEHEGRLYVKYGKLYSELKESQEDHFILANEILQSYRMNPILSYRFVRDSESEVIGLKIDLGPSVKGPILEFQKEAS